MEITLHHIGRRFNREWIFEDLNYTFEKGESYAVLGINGSGKSTLLQVIAGSLTPSSGTITYTTQDKNIDIDEVYPYFSIAAPYMELIEEFTLTEFLEFHFKFKSSLQHLKPKDIIALMGLEKSADKLIKYFSSGMKQRVKLAVALCSDTPVVLLDEPASNLDVAGIIWYKDLVAQFGNNRTLIICSNQEFEYDFCNFELQLADYKRH
ncbi:ABC transporter ATP-binding protein [Arcticibacter eurypsychrophilus]|uniref:ABC transporter ATP-binding protein n=1 Tax=Arcticibacter eurypsychrophilus TaxID=1434752 RepID=UPI00084DCEE5|nr:ABC transporter ATP-binding protein [Arcticibacter eurypsychrophilus]